MSLVVQTMPDDPTRLARWLDEILVGDRLGDLVDELAVVHPGRAGASLHQVLGEEVDVVLDRGLVSLSTDAFRALMRQPHLFLELQELVFLNGATYWSQISRPGSLGLRTAEMWTAIAKRLPSSEPVIPLREVKPRSREWYRDVAVSLATAAAIFLTITLVGRFGRANTPPVASVGWG